MQVMTQIMTQVLKNAVFLGGLEPHQSSSSPVSRTKPKSLKTLSFQGLFLCLFALITLYFTLYSIAYPLTVQA